jgi:hypothetical protein
MPDGAHEKVKLNVRVTPNKKDEWQADLDDDETLSSLVRSAVDKEVNDEYIPKQAINDFTGSGDGNVDLSPVESQLRDLRSAVTSVEHKLDTMSVSQSGDDEEMPQDIEELAMDLLPQVPSLKQLPEGVLKNVDGIKYSDTRELISLLIEARREVPEISFDGSAQRFAHETKEPIYIVREALCYLENETTENVQSAVVDGVRHWMKL